MLNLTLLVLSQPCSLTTLLDSKVAKSVHSNLLKMGGKNSITQGKLTVLLSNVGAGFLVCVEPNEAPPIYRVQGNV